MKQAIIAAVLAGGLAASAGSPSSRRPGRLAQPWPLW